MPLPAEIDVRLSCDPSVPLKVELEDARDGDGRSVIRGKSPFRRPDAEDLHWVSFDYYRADQPSGRVGDPRPAVVVSPITGGGYEVSRLIARDLVAHGYHAVIVRRLENKKALRAQVALRGFETGMRDAIAARRRVIDWLGTREEGDSSRIAAYGVSLGGVLTAVLAAVDDRVVASVGQGKDVAFITEGDQLLYSRFCRLLEEFRTRYPHIPVEVVPGETVDLPIPAQAEIVIEG